MTNRIAGDNYLARPAPKERKADSTRTNPGVTGKPAAPSPQTDVERAQQRLMQETGAPRPLAVDTLAQARARITLLKEQLDTDPQLAMRAQGRLNVNQFEAATARPST